MGVLDYFKPVSNWSAAQVKEFMARHREEEYNLVDVRQPKEYERGHLPGARLIPLKELAERLDELDPTKPTLVY
jgi:rhodanese-related sulfurtransferase